MTICEFCPHDEVIEIETVDRNHLENLYSILRAIYYAEPLANEYTPRQMVLDMAWEIIANVYGDDHFMAASERVDAREMVGMLH